MCCSSLLCPLTSAESRCAVLLCLFSICLSSVHPLTSDVQALTVTQFNPARTPHMSASHSVHFALTLIPTSTANNNMTHVWKMPRSNIRSPCLDAHSNISCFDSPLFLPSQLHCPPQPGSPLSLAPPPSLMASNSSLNPNLNPNPTIVFWNCRGLRRHLISGALQALINPSLTRHPPAIIVLVEHTGLPLSHTTDRPLLSSPLSLTTHGCTGITPTAAEDWRYCTTTPSPVSLCPR